ncbi:MAG: putative SOS response-associated peptidase YedK [Pirellulaceae bacterium]|jgi:putative SOS response-associated peptidase YedK
MCGRFTLHTPAAMLADIFQVPNAMQLPLRYNVAPTQQVAVVRSENEQRTLVTLRWGLIPSWATEASIGSRMINARSETLAEKPSFRSAFKRRRCLILTDGYYEWKKVGTKKQPYYIRMRDEQPFAMAGLWEQWRGPKDEPLDHSVQTCTIITTAANPMCEEIHDRMPVILDANDFDLWLDPDMQERETLENLLQTCSGDEMIADKVSTHVNSVKNDDVSCIAIQKELF